MLVLQQSLISPSAPLLLGVGPVGCLASCHQSLKTRMYLQNRNRLTDIENRLVVAKAEGESGREGLGVWDEQMQTIIYRTDKQQGPTV